MHNTEFRSHLCFGLRDAPPAFLEPQYMHVLGQMAGDVFPTCEWASHVSSREPAYPLPATPGVR